MLKNIFAITAAAGLALAPVAAQATTRAADAGISLDRVAAPMADAENLDGELPLWLLILLFGASAAALIILLDGDNNGASPGTGN